MPSRVAERFAIAFGKRSIHSTRARARQTIGDKHRSATQSSRAIPPCKIRARVGGGQPRRPVAQNTLSVRKNGVIILWSNFFVLAIPQLAGPKDHGTDSGVAGYPVRLSSEQFFSDLSRRFWTCTYVKADASCRTTEADRDGSDLIVGVVSHRKSTCRLPQMGSDTTYPGETLSRDPSTSVDSS